MRGERLHGNEGDEYMKNAVQRFGKFLSAMVMPNLLHGD